MSAKDRSLVVEALASSVTQVVEYAIVRLMQDTCKPPVDTARKIFLGAEAFKKLVAENSHHLQKIRVAGKWAYFYRGIEAGGDLVEGYPFILLKDKMRENNRSAVFFL